MRTIWIVVVVALLGVAGGCRAECDNGACGDCPPPPVGHYCTGSAGNTCYYCPYGYSCEGEGQCVMYGETDDGEPIAVEGPACITAAPVAE
jgi:hypothetical protein